MRFFKTLSFAFALLLSAKAFAADPSDILMIEIAGEANGIVEIELLPEIAPDHVQRIKKLTRDGAYNGIVFHRVIENFMAQTGDVTYGKEVGYQMRYAGIGGSVYPDLKQEFSDIPFEPGIVGMARGSDEDSANSQFFIMFERIDQLDGKYTVLGRVLKGMDVINDIKRGIRSANGAVVEPDVMKKVWIKADEAN